MLEKALLLTGDPSSSDDERAERLLEFFGVSFQRQSTKDFKLLTSSPIAGNISYRLVCAAQTFASVIGELQNGLQAATEFARHIHSVFLYSTGDAAAAAKSGSQFVERRSPLARDQKMRPSGGSQTMLVPCLGPCAVFAYTLPLLR